tara:strand:+ start:1944 stop:2111 length:168 start_codon:yes stop_codon:yes gene_type:complete
MFPDIPGYDNWKLSSEFEDAPPLDAKCEECEKETYRGLLIGDLCEDCDGKEEEEE